MIGIVYILFYLLFRNILSPTDMPKHHEAVPDRKYLGGASSHLPSAMKIEKSLDSKEKVTDDKKLTVFAPKQYTTFSLYVACTLHSYIPSRDYVYIQEFSDFVHKIEKEFGSVLIKLEKSVYESLFKGIHSSLTMASDRFKGNLNLDMILQQLKHDLYDALEKLTIGIIKRTWNHQLSLSRVESVLLMKERNYLWKLIVYFSSNTQHASIIWVYMTDVGKINSIIHDFYAHLRIYDPEKIIHELDVFRFKKIKADDPDQESNLDVTKEIRDKLDALHLFFVNLRNELHKLLTIPKYDVHNIQCTLLMGSIDEPLLFELRRILIRKVQRYTSMYPYHNPYFCLPQYSVDPLVGVLDSKMINSIRNYLQNWQSY